MVVYVLTTCTFWVYLEPRGWPFGSKPNAALLATSYLTSSTASVQTRSAMVNTGSTLHGSWCCWLYGPCLALERFINYNTDKYSRLGKQGRRRGWTFYEFITASIPALVFAAWRATLWVNRGPDSPSLDSAAADGTSGPTLANDKLNEWGFGQVVPLLRTWTDSQHA